MRKERMVSMMRKMLRMTSMIMMKIINQD